MVAAAHEVVTRAVGGRAAVALRSDADGGVEAVYIPGAGMVCCSLRHRDEELLGQRGGLERYVAERSTMGIPLLHPWANRLSEWRFRLGGKAVDVESGGDYAAADPNGLPIHGLLAGHPGWRVEAAEAELDGARLRASFDFAADARLIAAFPFPHTLGMEVSLRGTTLEVLTTLKASGADAVPVSFGYHPYLTLPGAAREDWQIELPVDEHLVLDQRMIPTGEREPPARAATGRLATRTFDDDYVGVAPGARFALAGGGRRIVVSFDEGYPVAVVFAPENDDVVCFEPMTAPTNALISGDGLTWLLPGDERRTRFSISVQSEGH